MHEIYQLQQYVFTPWSLAYVLAAPLILLLGLAVCYRERGHSVFWVYLLFTISISGWLFHTGLLMSATSAELAQTLVIMSKIPVSLLPGALYHYIQILIGSDRQHHRRIHLAWTGSVVFAFLVLLNLDYATVEHHSWGYYSDYGLSAIAFIGFFVVVFFSGVIDLINQSLQTLQGPQTLIRLRLMTGIMLVASLGFVDFLPGLGMDVEPFGMVFISLMFLSTTYVTWRYRLTDFRPEYMAENLLNMVASPILVFDEYGDVRQFNQKARDCFHPAAIPSLGRRLFPLIQEHHQAHSDEAEVPHMQYRDERIGGHTYEVSVSPIYTPSRILSGYVCLFNDISEHMHNLNRLEERVRSRTQALHEEIVRHRQTIEDLELAQDQAQQSIQAKGLFLSRMSHELRTPLNAILGFTQILQYDVENKGSVSGDHKEYLQHLRQASEHLLQLIEDVLEFTRLDSERLAMQRESIELVPELEKVITGHMTMAAARSIALHMDEASCSNSHIYGDRVRVTQVLNHLLDNAIRFCRPGGRVDIHCLRREARLRVSIRDEGMGIEPQYLPRLFTPFEQIPQHNHVVDGAGIGLALCRMLIQLQGGEMGVESTPGMGSTFWFELPMASASQSQPA